MKRSLVAVTLVVLAVFAAACATTPATPNTRGTVTAIQGAALTVAPVDGTTPVTVNTTRATRVVWQSGLAAQRASLATGQRVSVWSNEGVASKIVIEP